MPDPIAKRLAELSTLNAEALQTLWKELFHSSPAPKLRRNLLIAILAHKIQEQKYGGLKAATRTRLRQLARTLETDPNASVTSLPIFKPGTCLVREWQDQVHTVKIESDGYEYQDTHYKSLSHIARLITGTHRSGPAFFGIKKSAVEGDRSAR
jgi:hypothetical protein